MGLCVHRYGKYNALGLVNQWKLFWLAVAGVIAGYCFSDTVYPMTSNAGELALLLGLTFLLALVQHDLQLAAGFADFLHQSNLAFQPLPAVAAAERMARRVEEEMGAGASATRTREVELVMLQVSDSLDELVKTELREQRGGAPSFSVNLDALSTRSSKV